MLEIEECLERLLKEVKPKDETVMIPLTECCGRILAEDVRAEIMVPPYPKSAMDGYAVRAADTAGAGKDSPVRLKVAGELLAGDYEEIPYRERTAVRVMTGSFVPEGFDAVIRQEDTDYGMDEVEISAQVSPYTNYCRAGEDIKEGELVIPSGSALRPVHAGLLAGIGREKALVYEPARIAIISTGTELTETGKPLLPGKIYNTISYMLEASIRKQGLVVSKAEICRDEEELLQEKIKNAVENADMVITTGAVSVGKKDIVPHVLEMLGARVLFQGADIQPGTPTLASVLDEKVILSLSGNPYAALANFEYYFWPVMAGMMHSSAFETDTGNAVLDSEYTKVNRLRRMIRAHTKGGRVTIPSQIHASSVISNLTECNCFIDLEAGRAVKPGDTVRIRYFKDRTGGGRG